MSDINITMDDKAGFPETMKVGWQLYTIEWVDDEGWSQENEEAIGLTFSNQGLIKIRIGDKENPAYNFKQLQETLVHEILHAICHVSSLTDHFQAPRKKMQEEYTVSMMSGLLLQTIQENPHIFAFLQP